MTKENLIEKAREMIAAPSCCAELKAAGQAWIYEVGKDGEKVAAKNLIAEIKEDVQTVEGLEAFVNSGHAVEIFGEEGVKNFKKHVEDLKASGAKYCDCGACTPALSILENKDIILA